MTQDRPRSRSQDFGVTYLEYGARYDVYSGKSFIQFKNRQVYQHFNCSCKGRDGVRTQPIQIVMSDCQCEYVTCVQLLMILCRCARACVCDICFAVHCNRLNESRLAAFQDCHLHWPFSTWQLMNECNTICILIHSDIRVGKYESNHNMRCRRKQPRLLLA